MNESDTHMILMQNKPMNLIDIKHITTTFFSKAGFVLFLVVILLCIIVYFFIQLRKKLHSKARYAKFVKSTSKRYGYLCRLNDKLKMKKINPLTITTNVNSLQKFKSFNYENRIIKFLKEIDLDLDYYDKVNKYNKQVRRTYIKNLQFIPSFMTKKELRQILPRANFKRYRYIEENMCNSITKYCSLRNNQIYEHKYKENLIICEVSYTSPAGRNNYYDKREYTIHDVMQILDNVDSYNKSFAERERAKMTTTLRYSILKRDNFKCLICGRGSEDGVKLQVDHIIPVSKGGKTVEENLRTLCKDCNRGKSDAYDENGIN